MKMKRCREETELDGVNIKIRRMDETSRKRPRDEDGMERRIRQRVEGEFRIDGHEYRKMIVSLYQQNKRLLNRARSAEIRVNELETFVQCFINQQQPHNIHTSQHYPTLVK